MGEAGGGHGNIGYGRVRLCYLDANVVFRCAILLSLRPAAAIAEHFMLEEISLVLEGIAQATALIAKKYNTESLVSLLRCSTSFRPHVHLRWAAAIFAVLMWGFAVGGSGAG